eukprot:515410_1
MTMSAVFQSLGCDINSDNPKLDEWFPAGVNMQFFGHIMKSKDCNHEVDKILETSNNNNTCIIYELFLLNRKPIPKPYPIINFDLDEPYEDPAYKEWSDYIKHSPFLCQDCWLTLLPHLDKCIMHIHSNLMTYFKSIKTFRDYKQNAIQYFDTEESLIHLLFLIDMITYPFVCKYIFKRKKLYKMIFRYYFQILHAIYCTDIFLDEYKSQLILYHFTFSFTDQFFLSTFVFWKTKHTQYLRKNGFKKLLIESVMNNALANIDHKGLHSYTFTLTVLSLISCFDYVSEKKLLNKRSEKYKFVRNIIQFILTKETRRWD